MSQIVGAIFEGGVFVPLTGLQLQENQRVRIAVDADADASASDVSQRTAGDPLAGVRCDTGIADLAENFDDYRFGLRQS